MFEWFQKLPLWIVIIFTILWVTGWLFYFLGDRYKDDKKILIEGIGGGIGLLIAFLIFNEVSSNLLSGLSGIRRGIMGGLMNFIIIFPCMKISFFLYSLIIRTKSGNNKNI